MEIVRQPKSKIRTTDVLRLAAIARDFYLDGKSKIEIAESYGISRFKVARLLEEARAAGVCLSSTCRSESIRRCPGGCSQRTDCGTRSSSKAPRFPRRCYGLDWRVSPEIS